MKRFIFSLKLLTLIMHKYVLLELGAGKMKGIAFIKDPDGYWIEIFDLKTIGNIAVV